MKHSHTAKTNISRRFTAGAKCGWCGKLVFMTRKDARGAARRVHPGEHGMSAYECTHALADGITGLYHYGHTMKGGRNARQR